jgi:hypothetical protein
MSNFGLHLQTPVDGWEGEILRAALAGTPYKILKAFWVEAGTTTKSLSPSTTTVYRHDIQHKQPYLDKAGISPLMADEAADEMILRFKDSVNQHGNIDYVESLNETYASQDPVGQRKAVEFDRAFVRRLPIHCPNTKPVVYTAASGNIDHDEYEVLVPLARECAAANGAFGYHNYWSVVNSYSFVDSAEHMYDYHMRWAYSLDAYLVSRGIRVKWMLGESGPIGASPTGYWQKPDDGWLKSDVWGGSSLGYLVDLDCMDSLMNSSRPGVEGRLEGVTLFTSGIGIGWSYFQIQEPFLTKLTDYVMGSIQPPVPPPPTNDFEQMAWNVTSEMQRIGQNGIRLNAQAGIQRQVSEDNLYFGTDFQIVTAENKVDGRTVQAVESLSGLHPRRVYVWSPGEEIYWFEQP